MRDDFSSKSKDILAKRVAYRCSNPNCLKVTSGPHQLLDGTINIGVAAHIEAASLGGKRFNPLQSNEQRSSLDNGIWLCQNCAKLVDSDEYTYTVGVLKEWKRYTESVILQELINHNKNLFISVSDLVELTIANKNTFHKPNLVWHGKQIYSKEVVLTRFRNVGYRALNIFVAASLYHNSIQELIVDGQRILDIDEVLTITLKAELPLLASARGLINLSYEDVDGRRYQQHFTFGEGRPEITPAEILRNSEKDF